MPASKPRSDRGLAHEPALHRRRGQLLKLENEPASVQKKTTNMNKASFLALIAPLLASLAALHAAD